VRAQIAQNYVASEREARFALFHFGTFLIFALVSFAAILVDYISSASSGRGRLRMNSSNCPHAGKLLAFKSMQVLSHHRGAYSLEHMGKFGRAVFVRLVFVLALVMLMASVFCLRPCRYRTAWRPQAARAASAILSAPR